MSDVDLRKILDVDGGDLEGGEKDLVGLPFYEDSILLGRLFFLTSE